METTATPDLFPRTSPAGGEPLAEITPSTPEDVTGAVARARAAQAAWAALDVEARVAAVRGVRRAILARAEEIAKAIHEETGKPDAEAILGEVLASADVVAYWADLVADELEPFEPELDALAYPKKTGRVYRDPRGVIALVMPWNFPFALPLRTIVPALMAGNAVVLKPSEITPRVGKLLVALFDGLVPEGVLGIVQGGGDVGAALVAADVDAVVFTGSTATGKKIAHACAERLVPCTLELGGKDAAIVLADADLERAANGIVWGALMNAGQNCGAVERVYVVRSVAEAFTAKIVAATKALRYGEDVGPLTTARQKELVVRQLTAATAAGAKVLAGGEGAPDAPLGFLPTVVAIDHGDAELVTEETFGPVIPITTVEDAAEAVRRANETRYGLTASLWTADLRGAEKLARGLRAGVVTINNHSFTGAIPSMPWGGVGDSGWGFTGSPLALDHLTRPRVVVVDRNPAPRETWWYPYTPTLRRLALTFALVRGGAGSFGAWVGAVVALLGLLPKRAAELRSGKPS